MNRMSRCCSVSISGATCAVDQFIGNSPSYRYFATDGGLISYGPDQIDQWRGAATYVDRILKGEKPAVLPVQTPI